MIEEASFEKFLHANFGREIKVKNMILNRIPVSRSAAASVFLNEKNQLFCFIASRSSFNLGDIRKILRRMNLVPSEYLPPKSQADYFESIATRKFRDVYPGRGNIHERDLAYYKTLVPYNPALVMIAEVRDGIIKQFDPDSVSSWRVAMRLTYRRIKTI